MNNYLYINNQYITTIDELRECFRREEARQYGSDLFNELMENFINDDIDAFLRPLGEDELAGRIARIDRNQSDPEVMRQLIEAITDEMPVVDFDPTDFLEIVQTDVTGKQATLKVKVLKQANAVVQFLVKQKDGNGKRGILQLGKFASGKTIQLQLEIDPNGEEIVFMMGDTEIARKLPHEVLSSARPTSSPAVMNAIRRGVLGAYGHSTDNNLVKWYEQTPTQLTENELEFNVDGVKFKMKYVEGGTFWMGAQRGNVSGRNYDYNASNSEAKVHEVSLRSYYISETVVTQALWKAVMGKEPLFQCEERWTDKVGRGDDYPAYYVSWNDCQLFIKALNERLGGTFRLPTEAEWEFAARGGRQNAGAFFAGTVWCSENGAQKVHVVKVKKPNPLGVFDMSGNVWEWCQDWYGRYHRDKQNNPTGPSTGSERVLRGGSFCCTRSDCRVSSRNHKKPSDSGCDIGFRLCLPA